MTDSTSIQNTLPPLLMTWLQRTQLAGLDIVAVATHQFPVMGNQAFTAVPTLNPHLVRPSSITDSVKSLTQPPADSPNLLADAWQTQIQSINSDQPIKLQRWQQFVLISCLVTQQSTAGQSDHAILGCLIAPPFPDHMLDSLQLSLGWLWYGLVAQQQPQGARATQLLDLLVDVVAQPDAQSAAQEWVNQLKGLATALGHPDVGVSLFRIQQHQPKWWVAANIAWAVKGSPQMQTALELAALTLLENRSQQRSPWWTYPLQHRGDVFAVLLVENHDTSVHDPVASYPQVYQLMQASADMLEPVLRRWQQSEQNIVQHSYRASTSLLQKILGKGYLAYKLLAALLVALLLVITLIPVDDIVNAPLYIEGDKRYTITTPQQGYIIEVMARPGDKVNQGQVLAKLEDKDLKIEAAELHSQLEQSDGQFRQAMADMDAANSGLAVNQKQQAQSKLDLLSRKLDRTLIKAPISGVVVSGDWQQKIGTPVEEGAELFQVADVANYRVILHVPDKDMDMLKVGQAGRMKLASLPEQTFDFSINRLTAVAEVKDGENGFTVEATLLQTSPQLNPGMQGVGKIVVGKTNLLGSWTHSLIDWLRLKAWSLW